MDSLFKKMTDGIVNRSMSVEGETLRSKWQNTGLLEGLKTKHDTDSMVRMLENQAKELLRESTTMAAGDVEGFAAVAFPLVRRTFGQLLADKVVSVQPMSLPSQLIFFLDFKFNHAKTHAGAVVGESLYGGGKLGKGITEGVSLSGDNAEKSFYAMNQGYSSPSASISLTGHSTIGEGYICSSSWPDAGDVGQLGDEISGSQDQRAVSFDPDVLSDGTYYYKRFLIQLSAAQWNTVNLDNVIAMDLATTNMSGSTVVRRLTRINSRTSYQFAMVLRDVNNVWPNLGAAPTITFQYSHKDQFTAADALGAVKGSHQWYLEALSGTDQDFPEINLHVDSVDIRAVTKKLKVEWTPEVGQDLDAYHNLDAEVELTGILSEQIALEIDREILKDLLVGATAGTYYWSRQPGKFVEKLTGRPIDRSPTSMSTYPDFTGTVNAWYETLLETVNDVSAQIHRKTLRGGANFLICGPEVANVLEFTSGFRANVTHDVDKGSAGVLNIGSVSKKWEIYVDPYFPRAVILVGRKGAGFLESGYVYAPYVPLQVTPTIFDPDTFTPRKGVLTRYGKRMVRPDMYGIVVVEDLLGGMSYA